MAEPSVLPDGVQRRVTECIAAVTLPEDASSNEQAVIHCAFDDAHFPSIPLTIKWFVSNAIQVVPRQGAFF
jgi:hypothetical protein